MTPAAGGLDAWLGRTESSRLVLDLWPAAALAAALDRDDAPAPGAPLPPFWHHLYGLPVTKAAATGPDGHAARGGFLPPVPLPRRMWAGGRLFWHRPLRIGQTIERISTVKAITDKKGKNGPLVFVTVEHRFSGPDGLALVEEHDIVYREPAGSPAPPAARHTAPPPGPWQRRWLPDSVLLFRYSALTYNGHRIHYDHPYVTGVEGYPGLVVHGPLMATLMLDLLRRERPDAFLSRFSFRATAPLFAGEPLTVHARPEPDGALIKAWIEGPEGRLAMQGEAELGPKS
jgi:3-methylfumaryl-CoA hydratase